MDSGWLVRDGTVLSALEIAMTRKERRRGLVGRDGIDTALLIPATRWVHTFGMRFAIDVVHIDGEGRVVAVTTMSRRRLGRPVLRARSVVETAAGTAARWGLATGDVLEVR